MRKILYTLILLFILVIPLYTASYGLSGYGLDVAESDSEASVVADEASSVSLNGLSIDKIDEFSIGFSDTQLQLSWANEVLQRFLSSLTLKYYVVFIGVDPSWVDEALIRQNVHDDYMLTDLTALNLNRPEARAWAKFNIDLQFLYAPDSLKTAVVNYIDRNKVVYDAPANIQLGTGIPNAAYIPHDPFQDWLVSQVRQTFPETSGELTLVIINTYPDIRYFYFYNNTGPDYDIGPNSVNSFDSTKAVAGGGKDRLLFFDLSAGPTQYMNISRIIRPIFTFNLPAEKRAFSTQLAYLIDSVLVYKYPSFLVYPPVVFPEISFEAYWILNGSSIDPRSYFKPQTFVDILAELFGGYIRIKYVDRGLYSLSDFPDLQQRIIASVQAGKVPDYTVVHEWFLDNREFFLDPDPELEIPMIIILDATISYVGGVALNDEEGDPLFILATLPSVILTGTYQRVGQPIQTYLYPGDVIELKADVMPTVAGGELRIEGYVDGSVEIYILDGVGYYNLSQGMAFTPRFQQLFTNENIQVSFKPNTAGNTFFIILYNPSWTTSALDISIYSYFPGWIGMTTLLIHEAGHILTLSHPHNGFNYTAYERGDRLEKIVPTMWLWGMAEGYMTYFHVKGINDMFQIDQALIAYTALYFGLSYGAIREAIEPFERFGFTILPPEVENSIGQFNRTLSEIPTLLNSQKNYFEAFRRAYDAFFGMGNFSFNVEDYLLTLEYTILDSSGQPLPNVDVEVTYPNGTKKTFKADSNGVVSITRAPWGDYNLRVLWSGVEVGSARFTETSSGVRQISTDVFRFNIVFRDGDGDPLVNPLDEVRITHSVLGQLTYTEQGIQAIPGTITIERVTYLGVDVTPSQNRYDINGPTTLEINLRIYDLTISFTDANGNPVSKPVVIEINLQGRLLRLTASGASYQMPEGTFTISGVYVEGVNVISSQSQVTITQDTSLQLQLQIYRLEIRVFDTLNRDVSNNLDNVAVILRHPNGTEISFRGSLTIEQAVKGRWTVKEIRIGQYTEAVNRDINLESNQVVDVTLPIGRLTLEIYDSAGTTLLSDAEIEVRGPDGVSKTVSSGSTIEYALVGGYEVLRVTWRGVDVTPTARNLNFQGGDATLKVNAEVYSVQLIFTTAKGSEVPIERVGYTLYVEGQQFTLQNGRGLLPKGGIRITQVTYQGVTFTQEFYADSRPGAITIQLPIYSLKIDPFGLGNPLPSYSYELQHPNGSVIRGDATGPVTIEALPQGSYSLKIFYLGKEVYSESFSLAGDRTLQPDTRVRMVSGRVTDFLGFALSGAEVRVIDPVTGQVLTTTSTGGDGRYSVLVPDVEVVVETGFITTSSVRLGPGVQRGDIGVSFTPASLALIIIVIGGVVGLYIFMQRRGGIAIPKPSIQRPRKRVEMPRQTALICPNCGYANKPTAKFCMRCGTRLREA